ncbi:MAG TPA: hypothetical protein VMM18_12015 [Gemmatimonadaceae bacterium]|nr:hypothetical protein [Gemmatimonadaceae bacterium]
MVYTAWIATALACADTNIVRPSEGMGGTIVFASDRADGVFQLYAIGGDGGGLRRLTDDPEHHDIAPVLSHDGQWIAWQREITTTAGAIESVEIWVMRLDGREARAVVRNGSFNESPSWLAADAGLVYASRVTGNWEIFRVALDGSEPVNLTDNPFADQHPRVSPDGTRIVFHTNRDVNFEIYVMDADGGNLRNLSADPGEDRFPTWTPTGRIVWSRFVNSFDLWMMNGDGGTQRPLVASPFQDTHASASPDGGWIVYQSDRFGSFSLLVAPIAGGEPRALASAGEGTSDLSPMWGRSRD